MKKRIAVLVRERREEALRMAAGLTLAENDVDVYILGEAPADSLEAERGFEALEAMSIPLYGINFKRPGVVPVSVDEIARRLPSYASVLPY